LDCGDANLGRHWLFKQWRRHGPTEMLSTTPSSTKSWESRKPRRQKANTPRADARDSLAHLRISKCPAFEVPRGETVIARSKHGTHRCWSPMVIWEQKTPSCCRGHYFEVAIQVSNRSIIVSLRESQHILRRLNPPGSPVLHKQLIWRYFPKTMSDTHFRRDGGLQRSSGIPSLRRKQAPGCEGALEAPSSKVGSKPSRDSPDPDQLKDCDLPSLTNGSSGGSRTPCSSIVTDYDQFPNVLDWPIVNTAMPCSFDSQSMTA
jgi:hypothetical protein